MHSVNHIKMHVAADLARGLLDRAGLTYGDCDLDAYLPDDLGGFGSWPVYPEIAEYYGVPGSALFLKAATPRTGPARTMTRCEVVAKSFDVYARGPRERLTCQRVEAWLADGETVAFLREAAGPGAVAPRAVRAPESLSGTMMQAGVAFRS